MSKKAGRNSIKSVFFKDQEMEFTVLRTLMATYCNGATVGECLKVVRNTKNGDIQTFINEWQKLAEHSMQLGLSHEKEKDFLRAKEYYLQACNYFKSAFIILNPTDKRHKAFWQNSVDCFVKAGRYFNCPMEKFEVEFQNKLLPCYFIPANKNKQNPVIMLVTGGEGSNMENYFWIGAYALENGYSVLLYEGPGNYSTMHTANLTMLPNSELPIGRVLDKLFLREDIEKDKIALVGLSFGGYLVSRAAVFDKRITALIPNSPLTNIYKMLMSALPNYIFKIPDWLLNLSKTYFMSYSDRTTLDLLLWEGGVNNFKEGLKILEDFTIEGLEKDIHCPTLVLYSEGEGKEFENQAKNFYEKISSTEKRIRCFTNSEGAGSHCQTENNLLLSQEIITWLNCIWKITTNG